MPKKITEFGNNIFIVRTCDATGGAAERKREGKREGARQRETIRAKKVAFRFKPGARLGAVKKDRVN